MKFGRVRDSDPSQHRMLGRYLSASAFDRLPASCEWGDAASQVPNEGLNDIAGNDLLGDCEVARLYHAINVWTAANGPMFTCSLQAIIDFYKIVSGYDGTPQTDRGASDLVVIEIAQSVGLAGHKIAGAVAVDARDRAHVAAAIWLLGGLWISIELPDAWVQNSAAGATWDLAGPPNPAQGHAFLAVAYDDTGVYVITWGRRLKLTWQALAAYAVPSAGGAAYAAVSPDWIGASGSPPQGFDLQALLAEAPQIGGAV